MQSLSLPQNRGYLIAGVGGILAFLAFFFPYVYISATYTVRSILGTSRQTSAGSALGTGAQIGGLFFLELLIALAGIAVAALLLFGVRMLGSSSHSAAPNPLVTSLATQAQTWAIALIAIGGAGALLHILFMFVGLSNYGNSAAAAALFGFSVSISISWSVGAWLYLLAMLSVVGGGLAVIMKPAWLMRP